MLAKCQRMDERGKLLLGGLVVLLLAVRLETAQVGPSRLQAEVLELELIGSAAHFAAGPFGGAARRAVETPADVTEGIAALLGFSWLPASGGLALPLAPAGLVEDGRLELHRPGLP